MVWLAKPPEHIGNYALDSYNVAWATRGSTKKWSTSSHWKPTNRRVTKTCVGGFGDPTMGLVVRDMKKLALGVCGMRQVRARGPC